MIRHISTSIVGLLKLKDHELKAMLSSVTDDDGNHPQSVEEFRQALLEELDQGHRLIRSSGCDNFDPVRGCLGHKSP